jgi:hypothetical protein
MACEPLAREPSVGETPGAYLTKKPETSEKEAFEDVFTGLTSTGAGDALETETGKREIDSTETVRNLSIRTPTQC